MEFLLFGHNSVNCPIIGRISQDRNWFLQLLASFSVVIAVTLLTVGHFEVVIYQFIAE